MYTDQEAERFTRYIETISYPTRPKVACRYLGVDCRRLKMPDGTLEGPIGELRTQLSPNYWLGFNFDQRAGGDRTPFVKEVRIYPIKPEEQLPPALDDLNEASKEEPEFGLLKELPLLQSERDALRRDAVGR